jgi:hypothetical protein
MRAKIGRHVDFSDTLHMGAFALRDERIDATEHAARCTYHLYGIVEHSGGMNGGHYVAYVKRSKVWWYISDSSVRQVSTEQVLKSQAYMLFYEQSGSADSEEVQAEEQEQGEEEEAAGPVDGVAEAAGTGATTDSDDSEVDLADI